MESIDWSNRLLDDQRNNYWYWNNTASDFGFELLKKLKEVDNHNWLFNSTAQMYIILIARVRVQYGKIFYEHAKYFHEPKASENVA